MTSVLRGHSVRVIDRVGGGMQIDARCLVQHKNDGDVQLSSDSREKERSLRYTT